MRVSSAESLHVDTLMLIFEMWGLIKEGKMFLVKIKDDHHLQLNFYAN